jgi:hypothetical protein
MASKAEFDCTKQISDKDIDRISNSYPFPYDRVASHLGVSAQDIKADGKSEADRRTLVLKTWKQQEGSSATYKRLTSALLDIKHKDCAEKIHKMLKPATLEQQNSLKCATPVTVEQQNSSTSSE